MEENNEEDVIIDNDIKRLNFWKYYLKPASPTYGNAKASAEKAGYAYTYACNITSAPFFKRKLQHMNLYQNAETVLMEALKAPSKDKEGKVDAAVLRVKVDTAKHVTKNLGKDDGWTERAEVTGKNGSPVIVMPPELINKFKLGDLAEASEVEPEEDEGETLTWSDGQVIRDVVEDYNGDED